MSSKPTYDHLPYGKWTYDDGREVLFNRRYQPMWSKHPDQPAVKADPSERIAFQHQEWFYTDASAPKTNAETRAECRAALNAWGVG